jgi:hypothetical protein
MSRIWKEHLDPEKHRDFMRCGYQDAGGLPVRAPRENLLQQWVYFVRAASFTFQFHSLSQIEEAKAYFSQKIHPARREPHHEHEHYWQRWFERLPPGLQNESKRKKVLDALEKALHEFQAA